MNFTNEISIDQELIKGQEAKINYNGYLAQNGASNVSLVYGYDSDWKETDTVPMAKAEKGFELALKIKPYEDFNFCFKDENDNWDNNYGNNFSAKIKEEEQTITEISEEKALELDEIKKIEEEISNLFAELFENVEQENSEEAPNEIITPAFGEEPEPQEGQNVQNFNLDELIDQILTPILNSNNVTVPEYVPVDEVKSPEEFSTVEDVNALVENILNKEPEKEVNIDIEQYNDLVKSLEENTELAATVTEEVEVKPAKIAKKDFVVIEDEKEELEEEISLIESQIAEETEENKVNEELYPTVTDDFDLVAPRKLSGIYKFIKRIRLAFAKLFYGRFGSSSQED